MSKSKKILNVGKMEEAVNEALIRLERAVLSHESRGQVSSGEQAVYIERLETENKQMARDFSEMKKSCIALKNGYELLEEKYAKLENANDSAGKELVATLHDLDQIIARKSLH